MTTGGLLDLRPALRPGILVGPALTRGPAVVHLLKDPTTGVRMEVGAKEHFIIARLDGSRSLARRLSPQIYATNFHEEVERRQRALGIATRAAAAAATGVTSGGRTSRRPAVGAVSPGR